MGWVSASLGCRRNQKRTITERWRKPMASDLKTTRRRDMAKLRRKMDGDDGFMGGHQIKKVRQLIGQRDTPEWSASDTEVRKVLLRAFPKLNKDKNQRAG